MNNADYARYLGAKTSIKSFIKYVSNSQDMLSKDITKHINDSISAIYGINKRTPKRLQEQLREYANGLQEAYIEEKVVFLYKINGEFYRTGTNNYNNNMPVWDTLPRELWADIGQYGDLYWRDSLKPYFKRH